MLVCYDRQSGNGCRAANPNDAKACINCGRNLRFAALPLHDPGTVIGSYQTGRVIG